jgi:hypothetical protein
LRIVNKIEVFLSVSLVGWAYLHPSDLPCREGESRERSLRQLPPPTDLHTSGVAGDDGCVMHP